MWSSRGPPSCLPLTQQLRPDFSQLAKGPVRAAFQPKSQVSNLFREKMSSDLSEGLSVVLKERDKCVVMEKGQNLRTKLERM